MHALEWGFLQQHPMLGGVAAKSPQAKREPSQCRIPSGP